MTENQNNMTPEELIKKYIGRMYGSLEAASIEYFLETGHINGSFRVNLIEILTLYGSQQFTAGVEAGKRESKWIPVEERLPEQTDKRTTVGTFTIAIEGTRIVDALFDFVTKRFFYYNGRYIDNVTHWMIRELPSPPNPDKGGKEKEV